MTAKRSLINVHKLPMDLGTLAHERPRADVYRPHFDAGKSSEKKSFTSGTSHNVGVCDTPYQEGLRQKKAFRRLRRKSRNASVPRRRLLRLKKLSDQSVSTTGTSRPTVDTRSATVGSHFGALAYGGSRRCAGSKIALPITQRMQ